MNSINNENTENVEIGFGIHTAKHPETNETKFFGDFVFRGTAILPVRVVTEVISGCATQGPFDTEKECIEAMTEKVPNVQAMLTNLLVLIGADFKAIELNEPVKVASEEGPQVQ